MEVQFRIDGCNIYSLASGKLVAVAKDGKVVMQPNFNAMTRKVQEFYDSLSGTEEAPEVEAVPEAVPEVVPEIEDNPEWPDVEFARDHESVEDTAGGFEFENSADDPEDLPPFSAALGRQTPGFMEFCSRHDMNEAQIGLLVKKMEGLIYG